MRRAMLLLAWAAAAGSSGAPAAASAKPAAGDVPALIDRVLADPSDSEARVSLASAAALGSAEQKKAAAEERAELLAGAAEDRKKLLQMHALRARRVALWRRNFNKTCSLAAASDKTREAVALYEYVLVNAPVYSDNREELAAASEKVKDIFYRTIKREYPHLVRGRDKIDERDLASLLFYRASDQDDYNRYADSGGTQEVLNKADRFRRLERDLGTQYANLTKGINLYSKHHYAEARELFDEVLAFDRTNEEALFYWALAGGKLGPGAGDEAR